MATLNDLVVDWGIDNESIYSYDPAKYALVGNLTQDEVAVYDSAGGYNPGLAALAQALVVLEYLLLETGDRFVTEAGDGLLLD